MRLPAVDVYLSRAAVKLPFQPFSNCQCSVHMAVGPATIFFLNLLHNHSTQLLGNRRAATEQIRLKVPTACTLFT